MDELRFRVVGAFSLLTKLLCVFSLLGCCWRDHRCDVHMYTCCHFSGVARSTQLSCIYKSLTMQPLSCKQRKRLKWRGVCNITLSRRKTLARDYQLAHLPMLAPLRFIQIATRCAMEGTSFALLGHRLATSTIRRLNVATLSRRFSVFLNLAWVHAQTFSQGSRSGD